MLRVERRRSSLPAVHLVIMGCGRVGARLAMELDQEGHSVAVIDQSTASFRKLGQGYGGLTVTGVGFDRDTLLEAGIDRADAFAAVSSGDNSNIISARVARERFGVATVVARIYDPRRAEIYQRLGIPTVATVRWTSSQIMRHLFPEGAHDDFRDASGRIVLAQVNPNSGWVGRPLRQLEAETGARVAYLTRLGEGILPHSESVLQEGDLVHVIARSDDLARLQQDLSAEPAPH